MFRVPREALWALIADTESLNRETGLPPVRFSFTPREDGGSSVRGETRIAGLNLRYQELPYRWMRPENFSVKRILDNGPLREICLGMRFDAEKGGTRAGAFVDVTPRRALFTPVARAVAAATVNGLLSACRTFEAYLLEQAATPYPKLGAKPPAQADRLSRAAALLKRAGANAGLVERLSAHIAGAPVQELTTIRPYALADRWGIDRTEMLRTCLLAVQKPAEMLELRWRVLCPACRGAGESLQDLGAMSSAEVHCPSCNIRFGPEFDKSVEVCFSVPGRIRATESGLATYCIGGPARSPHVIAQWPLAPGEAFTQKVALVPGRYALTSPQAEQRREVEVRDVAGAAGREADITLCCGSECARIAWEPDAPLPASGTWRLRNTGDSPVLLRLETPDWLADVATAAVVTSLQEFRDQFSSQVLSRGVELAVRQICVVFSDLKNSTAMYGERGDAPSYAAVRDHFQFLREVLGKRGGGIVKTIGDAVMAVFPDPADALMAALEVQRLAPTRADPLVMKLGLHAGPALAVNANEVLDYFGQTVNLAARMQAQSLGGDVVIAAALVADARIAALIDSVRHELFRVTLRGTEEPTHVVRLWPNDPIEKETA